MYVYVADVGVKTGSRPKTFSYAGLVHSRLINVVCFYAYAT